MTRSRPIQPTRRHLIKGAAAASATLLLGRPAIAKGKTEIVIGNIDAYSGPAAVYSSIGRTPGGYFKMINEQGGINGRMIKYITYDDAYSPAKTVEQARKLVESDEIRGGPGCLNRFSASISGASAEVRLPSGVAAG